MKTRDRVISQDTLDHVYFSSQHSLQYLCENIARNDCAFLPSRQVMGLLSAIDPNAIASWAAFQRSWDRLEQDAFMRDGGTYRFRRHATYSVAPGQTSARQEPHQPHYQRLEYNRLNGGVSREFAPVESQMLQNKLLIATLELCCTLFGRMAPFFAWHVEVHQFRIYASQREVSPTPEGVHRDGVNFIFMMMVNRVNVINGETRLYDHNGRLLRQHLLASEMEAAIVNDEHVMHGVTPILQLDPEQPAFRDVLVVTFKKR
ncbi:2OG-Fe dioxygenase family protein [Pseudomonas entomophila]|uniref:2OG-Fe dioxygenase family protein n=1 Tax=Pseudomonas entomophila TaxID=312306 RepID=UPI0015E32044|nr:2OG-Fe dioxygenase family protein [Pseudomonas entomophila]MBA1193874.1 2OG-Fe dioxygenase family protein [Pseudomonas entomophila]